MAINATTVWEVRTAGTDTNGGGYDAAQVGGIDMSQQDAKNTVGNNISTTDVVGNNTTTLTSATATFTADIIGNIIYLVGGTAPLAATRRRVVSRTNATTIVVDATVSTGTGITMNVGGACATPGGAAVNFASGNTVWVKSGTYIQTSVTSNVAAGRWNQTGYMIGYGSTRGDNGGPPLLQADGVITNFIMINLGGLGYIKNIKCDGNSRTGSQAFAGTTNSKVGDCIAINCKGIAFNNAGGIFINCIADACDTTIPFTGSGTYYGCVAKNCAISGFRDGRFINCIADSCSGATSDGFLFNTGAQIAINCVAYNCGRHGFNCSNGVQITLTNCIAEDNGASGTGTGFIGVSNPEGLIWANCAAFSNATADFNLGTGKNSENNSSITGSGSFFTDAPNGDFTLNNTAGAGAAARAVGYPASFNEGLTANFIDVGVAQHEESASGGGEHSAVF